MPPMWQAEYIVIRSGPGQWALARSYSKLRKATTLKLD